jgi:hypothetical protein
MLFFSFSFDKCSARDAQKRMKVFITKLSLKKSDLMCTDSVSQRFVEFHNTEFHENPSSGFLAVSLVQM